jgi:hypothetical protein
VRLHGPRRRDPDEFQEPRDLVGHPASPGRHEAAFN